MPEGNFYMKGGIEEIHEEEETKDAKKPEGKEKKPEPSAAGKEKKQA